MKYTKWSEYSSNGRILMLREQSVTIEESRSRLPEFGAHPEKRGKPRGRAGRGPVVGYSRKSKLRHEVVCLEACQSLEVPPSGYVSSFTTLTYPGNTGWRNEYYDPELCAEHLKAWWERVRYRFGSGCYAIWCVELQKRGAWHYHLLILWPNPVTNPVDGNDLTWKARKDWVSWSWADVVAGVGCKPDPAHLRAGTNCERVRDFGTVIDYLEKAGPKEGVHLIGKSSIVAEQVKHRQRGDRQLRAQGLRPPGRWWGLLNRKRWKELRESPLEYWYSEDHPVSRAMSAAGVAWWFDLGKKKGYQFEYGTPKQYRGTGATATKRAQLKAEAKFND